MDRPFAPTCCTGLAVVAACLLVLVLVVLAARWRAGASQRDGFFTEDAREEPTRSYTPYTGTVPLGTWGDRPWAEAVPVPRGGASPCYGSLGDLDNLFQPICDTCLGARNYHDSIQRARPHPFAASSPVELLPYQAGPYWEGGLPVLN